MKAFEEAQIYGLTQVMGTLGRDTDGHGVQWWREVTLKSVAEKLYAQGVRIPSPEATARAEEDQAKELRIMRQDFESWVQLAPSNVQVWDYLYFCGWRKCAPRNLTALDALDEHRHLVEKHGARYDDPRGVR